MQAAVGDDGLGWWAVVGGGGLLCCWFAAVGTPVRSIGSRCQLHRLAGGTCSQPQKLWRSGVCVGDEGTIDRRRKGAYGALTTVTVRAVSRNCG